MHPEYLNLHSGLRMDNGFQLRMSRARLIIAAPDTILEHGT